MRIVQVYHSPVPVPYYGGIERVIENLCLGFLELGHQVDLITYRGHERIKGVNHIDLDGLYASNQLALEKFFELIPDSADVVHFHVPLDASKLSLPKVFTMHGNLKENESNDSLPENTIFLTQDHARRHGREKYIFNGVDPKKIPLAQKHINQRDYYAFLGRASLKRKGLHLAKKIAKAHKTKLLVGGGRGINFGNTRYLGHLNDQEKFSLLRAAKALLFPILWDEPFGLVMIEALFSGTPVFALRRGSVAEVLGQPGHDGMFLIADDWAQLSEMIFDYQAPDCSAIRNYAEKHFSHLVMAESYINEYQAML